MKVFLVSFADEVNRPALERLRIQAETMDVYDNFLGFHPKDLDAAFCEEFSDVMVRSNRGFGYFVWKPQILIQALRRLDVGDVIHYVDAGCHLNPAGRMRLQSYINMCVESDLGILVFSNSGASVQADPPKHQLPGFPMSAWTKGDLLDHFGVREDVNVLSSEQIVGTTFLLQKRPQTQRLVEDWLGVYRFDFRLADDSSSRSPNVQGFMEHRHDQAILSLLCMREKGYANVALNEIESSGDWGVMRQFPIHARRDLRHHWRRQIFKPVARIAPAVRHRCVKITAWVANRCRLVSGH